MRTNEKASVGTTNTTGRVSQQLIFEQSQLTLSFHSTTHFSIHGTRLMVTNSRTNRPICWISSCASRNVPPPTGAAAAGGGGVPSVRSFVSGGGPGVRGIGDIGGCGGKPSMRGTGNVGVGCAIRVGESGAARAGSRGGSAGTGTGFGSGDAGRLSCKRKQWRPYCFLTAL